jgi:hypothetical protein
MSTDMIKEKKKKSQLEDKIEDNHKLKMYTLGGKNEPSLVCTYE